MKDREKEEIKEIVEEVVKEEKEKNDVALKKEKKSKKRVIIIMSMIGLFLVAVMSVIFFMYLRKPVYKVIINDGGGIITESVVIEDNKVKKLPEVTPPDGKELVAWINKNNEAVRENIELIDDDEWTPIFEPIERDKVTLKFESGTNEKIPDIVITRGSQVILPVKPKKYKDWTFLYWNDKDGYIVLNNRIILEDTTFYAYWWKASPDDGDIEKVTIKFDTGTDEKIDSIKLIKGSNYIFPTPTKMKDGKIFKGWLDDKNVLLTNSSIVTKDITLTASWVDKYTCPSDCVVNEDGKSCTKTTIVEPTKELICQGTEYNGYCVDTSHLDCDRQCSSGYPFGDTEVDYPTSDGRLCCASKINKVEKNTCPAGYDRDGDKCKLVETLDCTEN